MKKFVNDPEQFVPEMLKGIALSNPNMLKYVPEYNLIMRSDSPRDDKVSIIQGSGSGHEPAHVMAVGPGMLDAACPGDVFAAPPTDYIYETTKLLKSEAGVLHIINNYTGDKMAFDMGRELAEADDIKVGTVVVDDDVSVKDSTYTIGRRGVAGNFFVIKALGAASERGDDLESLVALGERVNSVTRTMGMALTSCTPPAKGSPLFELGDDEIEVGIGIHGEPGISSAPWRPIVRLRSTSSVARRRASATGSVAARACRTPQARFTAVGRVATIRTPASPSGSPRTAARAIPMAPATPRAGAPRTAREAMASYSSSTVPMSRNARVRGSAR